MNARKIFFAGLLMFLVANVAHAEDFDPYFDWKIERPETYRQYESMMMNAGGIKIDLAAEIRKLITSGRYLEAAMFCKFFEPYQKITLGANYFDASLTELVAKLYLEADELDAAEQKINLLTLHAVDNPSKIRALTLRTDLLNRRGDYSEAYKCLVEITKLPEDVRDDKLNLLILAHAERTLCELGDTQKAVQIHNEINPHMTKIFGETGAATSAFISNATDLCRKLKEYEKAEAWLKFKVSRMHDRYEKTGENLPAVAMAQTELAEFYFETNDERGAKALEEAMNFADDCSGNMLYRKLYRDINRVAKKYLPADHPKVLRAEFGEVYANSTWGNVRQSVDFYEQNLAKFKKVFGERNGDFLDMMECLRDDYLRLGRYDDAKRIAEDNLNICRKNFGTDAAYTTDAAIDLAKICYRMGQYKSGDKLLAKVRAINSERLKEKPAPWFAEKLTKTEAEGARLRGDIVKYAECLRNASDFIEINDDFTLSKDVASIGKFLAWWLDVNKFLSMEGFSGNSNIDYAFANAFGSAGINYHPDRLNMMNTVAESDLNRGNLHDAERYAEQILRLSREHHGKGSFFEWMALNTLGKIHRAENNAAAALAADNRALQIAETVCGKNSLERLQSLDAIASDNAALGNVAEAIRIRRQALTDAPKFLEDNDAVTVQLMTNLAENYVAAGRYADAVKLCDKTLARQKMPVRVNGHITFYPAVTELIRIKATAQKLSGNTADAYANYRELIRAYEARRIAASYMSSAVSDSEDDARRFANAVPVYEDTAAVAADFNDAGFAFYCSELCKGRRLIDSFDDIFVSKSYLLTPAERKELAERQRVLDSCRALIEHAVAVKDDDLLIRSELAYFNLRIPTEGFKSDLREKYSDNAILKSSREQNRREINFGPFDLPDLKVLEQPSIWNWDAILKNFDVAKNRRAIPDGACLIEFMKTTDSLVVTFLRNEGDVQATTIPVDEEFFDKCSLYHNLTSYPNLEAMRYDLHILCTDGKNYFVTESRARPNANVSSVKDNAIFLDLRQKLSEEISATLMPTIEKYAGGSTRWIISPDAELNLVPFETLSYREKFLVYNVDVSYVPSLTVMNLMRNRERKNSYLGRSRKLLAMGNAVYGSTDGTTARDSRQKFFANLRGDRETKFDPKALQWSELEGTAHELETVTPLFDEATVLQREQASEKNLRELNSNGELSKYEYLLFATHGIFIPERPEYSAIVLSQNETDADHDGYITVGEWMGYDLRSDLIYLSACESGRGDYRMGEGIVGIPYALTVAGNKDTVMSLWKVDDAATAEFTAAVFDKLRQGQREVAAINNTKREFLKRDPSIWAAFVLYGI